MFILSNSNPSTFAIHLFIISFEMGALLRIPLFFSGLFDSETIYTPSSSVVGTSFHLTLFVGDKLKLSIKYFTEVGILHSLFKIHHLYIYSHPKFHLQYRQIMTMKQKNIAK